MEHDFSAFVRAIIKGQARLASRLLTTHPEFATRTFAAGATRGDAAPFFFEDIAHYCYQGDTALHMASAAFQRSTARLLVRKGAALDAKNRRGAEPLHYAADANTWNPTAQAETIRYPPLRGRKRQRERCKRCHTAPSGGENPFRGGGARPGGGWRRCAIEEQERLHAFRSGDSKYRTWRKRFTAGPRTTVGDHCGVARSRRKGRAC